MEDNNLPVIDLTNPQTLSDACNKYGFFYVPYDSDDLDLINKIIDNTKIFFSQDDNTKNLLAINKEGLGYAPLNRKKVGQKILELNELFSFRVGRLKCGNEELYSKYCEKMNRYANKIFLAVIKSFGLNPEKYKDTINPSCDTLTILHYPEPDKPDTCGISAHSDWGFITLLYITAMGLQININDKWVDVPNKENHFIVNIGYMLELLSAGHCKATRHRVMTVEEKYSVAFFFEPNLETIIEPCEITEKYKPIKFGDYMKSKISTYYKDTDK